LGALQNIKMKVLETQLHMVREQLKQMKINENIKEDMLELVQMGS